MLLASCLIIAASSSTRAALRGPRPFVSRVQPCAMPQRDIDPDNASILVCGGGGVALDVTRKLKNMGAWVWQLQRTDVRRKEIEGMMAIVAKGDALVKEDVERVFSEIEEIDAVICTLGGSVSDPSVDSQGNINIIEAAMKKGVTKFILVTSIGCGDSKDAPGEQVYKILEPVLVQKDKAEAKLQESGLPYVIVRPGGLTNDAGTGKGFLTEDKTVSGSISRSDVADVVLKALFSKAATGKILTALDSEKLAPGTSMPSTFDC
eukprot:gene6405-3020_t